MSPRSGCTAGLSQFVPPPKFLTLVDNGKNPVVGRQPPLNCLCDQARRLVKAGRGLGEVDNGLFEASLRREPCRMPSAVDGA